jgi:predicted nuclease of predicted toxin-antitoxin system
LLALAQARQPSVIRIRVEGLRDERLAMLIQQVIVAVADDLQRGSAVTVTATAVRVRELPLSTRT